jgi:hypothetical protein
MIKDGNYWKCPICPTWIDDEVARPFTVDDESAEQATAHFFEQYVLKGG